MRSEALTQTVTPPAPPPPPPALPATEAAPLDARTELRNELREQIRDAVRGARDASRDVARDAGRLAGEEARMDAELAQARAEVARLQAQDGARTVITSRDGATIVRGADGTLRITSKDGKTVTIQPGMLPGQVRDAMIPAEAMAQVPPPIPVQLGPPPGVIDAVVMMVAFIVAGIVLYPIARAWSRRMDRRPMPQAASPEIASRLDRLEQAVESVAIEMERVSEAQRYSAKLLTERLPERLPTLGGRDAVTAAAPAMPDARG